MCSVTCSATQARAIPMGSSAGNGTTAGGSGPGAGGSEPASVGGQRAEHPHRHSGLEHVWAAVRLWRGRITAVRLCTCRPTPSLAKCCGRQRDPQVTRTCAEDQPNAGPRRRGHGLLRHRSRAMSSFRRRNVRGYNYRDGGHWGDFGCRIAPIIARATARTIRPCSPRRRFAQLLGISISRSASVKRSGDETAGFAATTCCIAPLHERRSPPLSGGSHPGDLRRGFVPHWAHGHGVHRRLARVRDRLCQALRGQQRREGPLVAERDRERADAARDLLASLRDGGSGRRRGLRYGVRTTRSTASRAPKTRTCCATF